VASGPDKAMTCRYCQTTRVWRAWRKGIREEPAFYASQRRTGSNLADLGRRRRAPASLITETGNSPDGRRADGEAGVTCCGVATAMSQGPSRVPPPPSDQQVNTGTTSGLPRGPRSQRGRSGWAHRRPTGQGWGGAAVVVAGVTTCHGGRESRSQGEGRQWFREELGGCNAERCGTEWCRPVGANDPTSDMPVGSRRRVSEMQANLHSWAVADPGLRFDPGRNHGEPVAVRAARRVRRAAWGNGPAAMPAPRPRPTPPRRPLFRLEAGLLLQREPRKATARMTE
jgi:hypothetical protein